MLDIKKKKDVVNLENELAEYLKREKEKAFAMGVGWSYSSDDRKGVITEYADGTKVYTPYDGK